MAMVTGSRRPAVLLVGLLLGLLPGVAAGAEPVPPLVVSWEVSLDGNALTVHANHAPLRLVLVELARQGGFRLHLGQGLEEAVVSTRFERLPLDEGLDRLLVGWPHAVLHASGTAGAGVRQVRRMTDLVVLAPAGAASREPPTGGASLAAALASPDPQLRIQALEQWAAQREGSGVDPLTYALVDPDENVRARAQELFEAALTRE